jgi:hypothetical protein
VEPGAGVGGLSFARYLLLKETRLLNRLTGALKNLENASFVRTYRQLAHARSLYPLRSRLYR